MRTKTEGYFTVEAAMILPIVLMVIFFVIYMFFFQYNRCLMEQDIGAMAIKGIYLEAENNEQRVMKLQAISGMIDTEKYIGWKCDAIKCRVEKGTLCVEQSGNLGVTMGGFDIQTGSTAATFKNRLVSPVSFIRNYHKVRGGV